MSERIRVGFVGLGGICRSRHVPGLRKIDGVEIVAVANRGFESSARAAEELAIPVVCETWEELLAREDLDAVFIGTWPYMHAPVAIAALESGKHVFCQARMAMNAEEGAAMYRKAQETRKVAALCPVPIGLSVDATIARLLRDACLGEVRLVRVESYTDTFASPDAQMSWRKDHRLSGHNMHTLGMYVEVMHRWFGGTRTVSAVTQTFTPVRTDPSGKRVPVKIPDQVLINTTMAKGIPVQYAISSALSRNRDVVEVFGTEASLRYDVAADTLYAARGKEDWSPVEIRPEDAYDVENWRVEQDFIAAIREGREYHPDFLDGLRYMKVVDAVHASAEQEKAIVLEDMP